MFVALWFSSKLKVLGPNPREDIKIFKTGKWKVHKTQHSTSAASILFIKNLVIKISPSLLSIWNEAILLVNGPPFQNESGPKDPI